jgi:hypothetical protein
MRKFMKNAWIDEINSVKKEKTRFFFRRIVIPIFMKPGRYVQDKI